MTRIDAVLAKRIKLVVLDVDGVMTDGGIVLGDVSGQRLELKRYDIQDGLGVKMLQWAGIRVALVTGRVSMSVELRAQELGIEDVIQDQHARKIVAVRRLANQHGVALEDVACLGDDLPDLGVMREVGLPVAVSNASEDAIKAAKVHLTRMGGAGAIREFAELLLRARGEWDGLVESYVKSRDTEGIPA
ncbi:MAG TPA: HAD hydrolase family protein [Gemmatimonadaceae bacterium]|jgi:3-deoxy-D-manno-octulosonate 8-phosphate phosphatase (KDO 8-P phosphatase)